MSPKAKRPKLSVQPSHKASQVFFEEEGGSLLPDWPARSPDFFIIENLWDYLQIQVSKHKIPNLQELLTIDESEFFKIPVNFIENLFELILKGIDAVIKNKGHPIRY